MAWLHEHESRGESSRRIHQTLETQGTADHGFDVLIALLYD
jgi:hypothetical protein